MAKNILSVYDYVIFLGSLIFPLFVGFYYNLTGGGQKTINEHLLSDSKMTIFPVAFSLMASFLSAITLLGLPAEIMMFGTQFAFINVAYFLATPIICYLILPVFYEKKYLSVFEYLEQRFNFTLRKILSYFFIISMIFYMGIVLYAPALAICTITDMPKWSTIIGIGIVCTTYCICGGIKAILWNDVFQSVLMFSCMILIICKGIYLLGFRNIINMSLDGERFEFFNTNLDLTTRHTVWTQIIGGIFLYLSIYSVNQTQIQRLITLPTLRKSQLSLWFSLPITSALSLTTCFTGLVMYAYFQHCDPLLSNEVKKADQMIPLLMMRFFNHIPGLPGLIISGIFAGAISSVSSFVNSLAAVTLEETIKPLFKNRNLTENQAVISSKLLAVFYGLLCLFISYLSEKIPRLLESSLILFGLLGGPMLAIFTLGISSKKCTSKGALIGFIASLLFGLIISLGPILYVQTPKSLPRLIDQCPANQTIQFIKKQIETSNLDSLLKETNKNDVFILFKISYMWICPLTWLVATLIALTISYIFPDPNLNVSDDLLMPILRKKIQPNDLNLTNKIIQMKNLDFY